MSHQSRHACAFMAVRHLLAIAALPFTVAVLVPAWLERGGSHAWQLARSPGRLLAQGAGVLALTVGLALFCATLWRFAVDGRGTLAPWDPPRALVVGGPYRYVRNPMISGVFLVLVGEALVRLSPRLAQWAAVFAIVSLVYIPFVEEPLLARRFGDAYREFARHVPRFVPRLRPWRGPG